MFLKVDDGGGEFDTEDMLKIDYGNIVGELLTYPVIVNRVGILRAESQDAVRRKKLEVDIYRADLAERYRMELSTMVTDSTGARKRKEPVRDAVNNMVEKDEGMKLKVGELHRAERDYDYIDAFYWAVKSKDTKLKAISQHIDMDMEKDIIIGVINGIEIKKTKKPFG